MNANEIVLPFPDRPRTLRNVRSTVLLSSIAGIREAGHFDAYRAALDPATRDVLMETVAGVWLPLEIGLAHYRACDSLGLSGDQQAQLGRITFERTKGTLLGTAVRLAQTSGVTPWTVVPYFQRFWERGYDGGALAVTATGPKEALVHVIDTPLVDVTYYRNALRGLLSAVVGLFCRTTYANEQPGRRRRGEVVYRAQWV